MSSHQSGGDIIKLLTGFCQNWALLPLIQSFYTLYFRGYIISLDSILFPVKLIELQKDINRSYIVKYI
jgi:hypothetical protein